MKRTVLGLLLVLLVGCGGNRERDESTFVVPPPAPPDTARVDTVATTEPTPATPAPEREDRPSEPRPANPSPPRPDEAAPTQEEIGPGWTAGIVSRSHEPPDVPILRAIRSATHAQYDRVVFEFDAGLPSYHIEYVDRPVRECGSGNPVEMRYDGLLSIRFSMAHAHDRNYNPTIANRLHTVNHPNLKAYRLLCDFEGVVTVVLGLGSPNPYRPLELTDPPRLVLDVRK